MTKKIIVRADSALQELAKKHFSLVEKLKEVLILSQLGFLQAGKYLYEIRTTKSYQTEDSSHEVTFVEFIERPDIPLPGRTIESRMRISQALMRIYRTFKLEHKIKDQELAEIGWTKLDIIARILANSKKKKEDVDEWLEKAKILGIRDLTLETSSISHPETDTLDCEHKDHPEWIKEIHLWKCTHCGSLWKAAPPFVKNK